VTHAIVLVEAERTALPTLGGILADVDGVAEAYSVTGEWDFVAIVRVYLLHHPPNVVFDRKLGEIQVNGDQIGKMAGVFRIERGDFDLLGQSRGQLENRRSHFGRFAHRLFRPGEIRPNAIDALAGCRQRAGGLSAGSAADGFWNPGSSRLSNARLGRDHPRYASGLC